MSEMLQFTSFQLTCEETIRSFAKRAGLPVVCSDFADPIKTGAFGVKLIVGDYSFWIYPDGAQIDIGDRDQRFEIEDYQSLDELKSKFLRVADEVLSFNSDS